MYFIDLSGAV